MVLGIKPWTLYMLGKICTNQVTFPQPLGWGLFCIFFLDQTGLELRDPPQPLVLEESHYIASQDLNLQ